MRLEDVRDYSIAKDYIQAELVGREYAEVRPEFVFKEVSSELGIKERFSLPGSEFGMGNGSIIVDRNLMKAWKAQGVSLADIEKAARDNAEMMQDYRMLPLSNALADFTGQEPSEYEIEVQPLVVTNRESNMGASAIQLPEVQAELESRFPDGYVILPSSIHEVLIMPKPDTMEELMNMSAMVREINGGVVAPDERLADEVLVVKDGKLLSAEKELAAELSNTQEQTRKHGRTM